MASQRVENVFFHSTGIQLSPQDETSEFGAQAFVQTCDFLNTKNIEGRLLDMGAGTGATTVGFSAIGFAASGIEICPRRAAIACETIALNKSSAVVSEGSVFDNPPIPRFDIVYSNMSDTLGQQKGQGPNGVELPIKTINASTQLVRVGGTLIVVVVSSADYAAFESCQV